MIIPELGYSRRGDDFMAVLKFESFKDLTQFFYERPGFLERLIGFNSYIEKPLRGNQEECWLFISNNDFGLLESSLGVTQKDLRSGNTIRNMLSGKNGTVYDNNPPSKEPMTHIKVKTKTGYRKWLIKNVETIK